MASERLKHPILKAWKKPFPHPVTFLTASNTFRSQTLRYHGTMRCRYAENSQQVDK
jgi:hypothetical protein